MSTRRCLTIDVSRPLLQLDTLYSALCSCHGRVTFDQRVAGKCGHCTSILWNAPIFFLSGVCSPLVTHFSDTETLCCSQGEKIHMPDLPYWQLLAPQVYLSSKSLWLGMIHQDTWRYKLNDFLFPVSFSSPSPHTVTDNRSYHPLVPTHIIFVHTPHPSILWAWSTTKTFCDLLDQTKTNLDNKELTMSSTIELTGVCLTYFHLILSSDSFHVILAGDLLLHFIQAWVHICGSKLWNNLSSVNWHTTGKSSVCCQDHFDRPLRPCVVQDGEVTAAVENQAYKCGDLTLTWCICTAFPAFPGFPPMKGWSFPMA